MIGSEVKAILQNRWILPIGLQPAQQTCLVCGAIFGANNDTPSLPLPSPPPPCKMKLKNCVFGYFLVLLLLSVDVKKPACCTGCRADPPPLKLHQ